MEVISTIAVVTLVGFLIAAVVLLRKTGPKVAKKAPEAVREAKLEEHKAEVKNEPTAPQPSFERVVREEPVYDRMSAPRRQYGERPAPEDTTFLFGEGAPGSSIYEPEKSDKPTI